MNNNRLLVCLILLPLFFLHAGEYSSASGNELGFYAPPAKAGLLPLVQTSEIRNIILLIGDGMGLAHSSGTRMEVLGAEGRLHIETMPVTGIINTHSSDALVPDSAATGTALATGRRTRNGMIGMAPDGTPLVTVMEQARDKGLGTGLVATSTISHATPASFGAHVKSRKAEAVICEQLVESGFNVLLGGGREYFLPAGRSGSKRTDDKDLIAKAREDGYEYVETAKALSKIKGDRVLGLFQPGALSTQAPEPSLQDLTEKALEICAGDEDGFFLMVEGSQIDWAAHANDRDYMVRQLLLFDMAVGEALKFAGKDGKTLVVVVADHETGGLTVTGGSLEGGKTSFKWSSKGHTAAPVILYAYGPGALRFTGCRDNTEIAELFRELLELE